MLKRYVSLCLLLLCAALALTAQVVPDRYIVELAGETAGSVAARQHHTPRQSDAVFRARVAELRTQQAEVEKLLVQHGAQVLGRTQAVLNALAVKVPASRLAELRSIPGVVKIHPVRTLKPLLDHALPLQHVPDAWNQIGGMTNAGLGIKIGIIDTGIDNTHPAFQDPSLTVPSGFPLVNQSSDLAFTNNKIIVARAYTDTPTQPYDASDQVGHGTGVAMAAAGETNTGPYGTITGVAPKAFLGNYKIFPAATSDLVLKALDDAEADGMDVVNMSFGTAVAPLPADDPDAIAVENAVSAGLIVVVAAGNNGPAPNTISSPGTAPHAITVGSMSNDRIFTSTLQVNGGAPIAALPSNGPSPAAPVSGPIVDLTTALDPTGLACSPFPSGSLTGSVALILRGTCTFESKIDNVASAGAVAALVYAAPDSPDAVNMAVGAATLPAAMVDNSTGNMIKQLAAAGTVSVTLNFTIQPVSVNPDQISSYSSLGPNLDFSIKPDLVAVGGPVSTAQPVAAGGYVVEMGTSLSSPMVAGAAALLKGGRPGLTATQYRSLLLNTAGLFPTPVSVQQTGSGMLNALAPLQSSLVVSPTSLSFGIGGDINQSVSFTLANIGTAPDTYSLTVLPVNGSAAPVLGNGTVQVAAGQSQTVNLQFQASGPAAAVYEGYVQIQGTQSSVISQIPYWYAVPSGVPAQIAILDAPTTAAAGSQQTILCRTTDQQGISVNQRPTITFLSGTGRVLRTVSLNEEIPGAYQSTVQVGTRDSGTADVIQLQVGSAVVNVTIAVQ